MIKFDFTSHFIIVLCLMVILVNTLIIINYSVNQNGVWGLLCNLSKGLQSICYATAKLTRHSAVSDLPLQPHHSVCSSVSFSVVSILSKCRMSCLNITVYCTRCPEKRNNIVLYLFFFTNLNILF